MRQIGTLPKGLDAQALADYLLSLGMKIRIDDHPQGWEVWIYNEDHIARASSEIESFLRHPDDPRYREASQAAETIRRKEQQLEKRFRKNYRDAADVWGYPDFRRRPLTTILIVACVVIFVLQNVPSYRWLTDGLLFSSFTVKDGRVHGFDLNDIKDGQVWRLITPMLMHVNLLHIVFNMLCLRQFGTLIEVRRGTTRFALLVLATAVISNLGEYFWMERMEEILPFEGMSGVNYGLFGYIWMKGLYEPEQGMGVNSGTINVMVFWLFLCMTGVMGAIANAAHFVGLAVGMVFGLLRL